MTHFSLARPIGTLLLLLLSTSASGMGKLLLPSGTNACYAAPNFGDEDIQSLTITDALDPGRHFPGRAHAPARIRRPNETPERTAGINYPPSVAGGGACYRWDTGHQVPEHVLISWRKLPLPGDREYTGEPVGPFQVEVRSKIPREVLALASGRSYDYSIDIQFTSGVHPVRVNWILRRSHAEPIFGEDLTHLRRTSPQIELVCTGGDSFESHGLRELEWGWERGRDIIRLPVWPHCTLP